MKKGLSPTAWSTFSLPSSKGFFLYLITPVRCECLFIASEDKSQLSLVNC